MITPAPNYKGESFKGLQFMSAPSYSMGTRSRYRKKDQVRIMYIYITIEIHYII